MKHPNHCLPKSRISRPCGFTLVELLVVIAIIAVLVTVTVTMTFRFRTSADRTSAMNALRQIQTGNVSYAMENSGSFVPPESKVLAGDGSDTGVTYRWFENPDFIAQLKGAEATFRNNETQPDISLPESLLDLAVIRKKTANQTGLDDCFGYTAPSAGTPFRQAQLSNPGNSAAFITCDKPFVEHATKADIAFRHQEKALAAYYDGRVAILTKADLQRIDTQGGAANVFWAASDGPTVP